MRVIPKTMPTKNSPTITICSSVHSYRQAVSIQSGLEAMGFRVLIPDTAEHMKKSGDFEADHYKTWFGDAKDYQKKTALMRGHFDKVDAGDAVLVLNYEKKRRSKLYRRKRAYGNGPGFPSEETHLPVQRNT